MAGVRAFTGGTSHAAPHEAALSGYWQATGRVLATHDSVNQSPGQILRRQWWIGQLCDHTCTVDLTRQVAGPRPQTIGATITAPLVRSGDHWLATFEQPNVACQGAGGLISGVEDSTWTIRLGRDGTITATESTTTHSDACTTETSSLAWSARRLAAQSPAA